MGRHSGGGSYGHHVSDLGGWMGIRVYWTVDRYVNGSRLRFPTVYSKDVDEEGARRFAKKWGCKLPPSLAEKPD